MRPNQEQYCFIDSLKVFAAQIIILHHCMSYGELATAANELLPNFSILLFDYGRYAVQVFLVMAGYLAAQSFEKMMAAQAPAGKREAGSVLRLALRRYLRLVGPYSIAIVITIGCAALARQWSAAEYIGQAETVQQVLAHLFFMQGLLGYESISAGVWYVAIDWQLYTVLAIVYATFSQRLHRIGMLAVLILASLFFFNRHADYENTFVYFIGSYGLGVLAYWAGSVYAIKANRDQAAAKKILLVIAIIVILSAFHSVWLRNYLALAIALLLMLFGQVPYATDPVAEDGKRVVWRVLLSKALQWASARAYCAFLIHFAFILLANTALIALGIQSTVVAVALIGMVSILSWVAANYLYRWVELPIGRWRPAALFSSSKPF